MLLSLYGSQTFVCVCVYAHISVCPFTPVCRPACLPLCGHARMHALTQPHIDTQAFIQVVFGVVQIQLY